MKKRIFGLLSAAVLLLSLCTAAPARAASPESDFEFDTPTGTITQYSGGGGAVEIPATINGTAVTAIGDIAFYCKASVTSVTIPAGVTAIGTATFDGCTALTEVTFEGQPASIGTEAFNEVGSSSACALNLPASWTGDPQPGNGIAWLGGTFNVTKATPPHVHSFTYSAADHVLTATCANTDGKCGLTDARVTLTLTSPMGAVYDGNAKECTYADGEAAAWKAATGSDAPAITYADSFGDALPDGKPVDAGEYTASATADGQTAALSFTINKAAPAADLFTFTAPKNCEYDEQPKRARLEIAGSSIAGMGSLTVLYSTDGGTSFSTEPPVEVGKCKVALRINEGTNFTAAERITADAWSFEITAPLPPHTHDSLEFLPWTSTTSLPTAAGSWVLTGDVELAGGWTVSNEINLCLNGYNIVRTGGNAVTVNDGGTLSVYDCSSKTHRFDADGTGLWVLNEASGTKSLTGGCILGLTPGTGDTDGIGVFINKGGTLNLYAGNIVGCKATGSGGVLVCEGGTFNMFGGSVSGNTAGGGEGGGGVYVAGTFNMTGGSISGNSSTGEGGGVCGDGTIILGGKAQISGNSRNGAEENLNLRTNRFIQIDSPAAEMAVGITMQDGTGRFTSNGTADDAAYFTPDDSKYAVIFKTDHLELGIVLQSIAVTTPPAKTGYTVGESFDKTGMVVTATYSDGSTKAVDGYTLSPSGALTLTDSSVTVTYTENGVKKTAAQGITVKPVDYVITAGAGSAWTKGGAAGLDFTSNAPYDKFSGVQVDGVLINRIHYTASSGSTNIHLKPTYLETLALGEHTLTIVSSDGSASCKFAILEPTGPFTVSFQMNGHGSQVVSQTVAKGAKAAQPAAPTAAGYTFGGWYTDAACTVKYDFSTPVNGNLTLYAKWTGGSGSGNTDAPSTGDGSHLWLWSALAAVSLLGCAGIAFRVERKKED